MILSAVLNGSNDSLASNVMIIGARRITEITQGLSLGIVLTAKTDGQIIAYVRIFSSKVKDACCNAQLLCRTTHFGTSM